MIQEKVIQSRNIRIWDYKKKVYLEKANEKFIDSIDLSSQKYEVEDYLGEDSKGKAVYSFDILVADDDPRDKIVIFKQRGAVFAMNVGVGGIENGEGRRYRIELFAVLKMFHKVGNIRNLGDRG